MQNTLTEEHQTHKNQIGNNVLNQLQELLHIAREHAHVDVSPINSASKMTKLCTFSPILSYLNYKILQ